MRQILSLFLLLLVPLAARADGIFIPPVAFPAKVTIPDQRALICFSNGTERLVIETRFTGSGTNFAWIVPLPSQPIVEEATTGLFPTLQYLFRPQIIHDVAHYYAGVLALIGIGYLLLFVRPTGQLTWPDVLACLSVGVGAATGSHREIFDAGAFLIVAAVLFGSVVIIRVAQRSPLPIFILLFLGFFCLASLFLPALASRGILPVASAEPISILDRKMAGVYETTTIASHDAKALQTWLSENGYAVPTNAEPVIASYARNGWVFVAAKVRRDNAALDTNTPQPLSFTFKTGQPVYPMRLTGLGNQPLSVDLYVFSNERATAPHFKVESCTRPNIVHPLLRQWTAGLPVATKLTAKLSPAGMRDDIWLEQKPFFLEQNNRLFSRQGALITALNWGMVIFAAGLIMACLFTFASERHKGHLLRSIGLVTGASIVIVGSSYLCLPKIEVKLMKAHLYGDWGEQRIALRLVLDDLEPKTVDEARKGLQNLISNPTNATPYYEGNWDNLLVGGKVHEEDSPGNYLLRETNHQLELVTFTPDGEEQVSETLDLPPRR
jgi:Uncharacterized protein conserved in bacteria (DUF2330)